MTEDMESGRSDAAMSALEAALENEWKWFFPGYLGFTDSLGKDWHNCQGPYSSEERVRIRDVLLGILENGDRDSSVAAAIMLAESDRDAAISTLARQYALVEVVTEVDADNEWNSSYEQQQCGPALRSLGLSVPDAMVGVLDCFVLLWPEKEVFYSRDTMLMAETARQYNSGLRQLMEAREFLKLERLATSEEERREFVHKAYQKVRDSKGSGTFSD